MIWFLNNYVSSSPTPTPFNEALDRFSDLAEIFKVTVELNTRSDLRVG